MSSFNLNFYRHHRPELYTPNCHNATESIVYRSGMPKPLFPTSIPAFDHHDRQPTSNHHHHHIDIINNDVVLSVTNSDPIIVFLMKSGKVFLTGSGARNLLNSINLEEANDENDEQLERLTLEDQMVPNEALRELKTEKLRKMDKSPFKQFCGSNSVLYAVMESGRMFSLAGGADQWVEEKFGQEEALHFEYVGSGLSHVMAMTRDHQVYGKGSDSYGCLSGCNGKINFENVLDTDDYILDVYAAYYRTLAVTAHGKLLTTGWGVYTQQGLGNNADNVLHFVRHEPMNNFGEHVVKVALGALHTVVLTKSRKVYGFGFNSYGQLSQGQYTNDFPLPVLIQTPQPIVDIWCGWHHTIFESANGSFYCSGSNGSNELYGVSEDHKGKNIFEMISFSTPQNEEYLRWKIEVCSFASNSYYHGIRLNGKRIEWMISNLKEMTKSRREYSDLIFIWDY